MAAGAAYRSRLLSLVWLRSGVPPFPACGWGCCHCDRRRGPLLASSLSPPPPPPCLLLPPWTITDSAGLVRVEVGVAAGTGAVLRRHRSLPTAHGPAGGEGVVSHVDGAGGLDHAASAYALAFVG